MRVCGDEGAELHLVVSWGSGDAGRLGEQRIRRGVFHSVAELEAAIHDYLEHHNANPKPFVWTASAPRNFARGRQAFRVTTLA
jgi:hypothetical protein